MRKSIIVIGLAALLLPLVTTAQEVRPIVFPVDGAYSYTDTFGEARSGGRTHEGVDIFTKKMTPLVSAVNGRVVSLPQNEPSYGYAIFIRGDDGYEYWYLHVNNDTPGTDDDMGGALYAYAPTIVWGARVVAGQLIGWAGDSGNAENVGSHLHFEIHLPNGTPIDPYASLQAAAHPGTFSPADAKAAATSINDDKTLPTAASSTCQSNTLVKGSTTAVYYCGADGKRYVFPNQRIYLSWYQNFSGVVKLTDEQLASIPLGGNVTYRPGVRMVKVETDPKVYAVAPGGILRYVTTPEIAASLYGQKWNAFVDDLSDAFFVNYRVGAPVTAPLTP